MVRWPAAYLQLLFAVEVVEEVVKVDLRHLLEQREEAGNVLPLHAGEKTKLSQVAWTRSNSAPLRNNLCLLTKDSELPTEPSNQKAPE